MTSSRPFVRLTPAALEIGPNDTPRSQRFQDTYFDANDGLAETRHVFVDGCGLPETWQNSTRFTIGETGFGTGLNFLTAWHLWQKDPHRPRQLHYVSVEGFPLTPKDFKACHACWPEELQPLAQQLEAVYPSPQPGYHRVFLDDGKVLLTLLFGDVLDMLGDLDATIDAWFLDGFAPDRNPEMWRPEVFSEVARLSHPETRLATFTVAGPVRRGLAAAGFALNKRPGFGKKREVLSGTFEGPIQKTRQEPWFKRPKGAAAIHRTPKTDVVIIGNGLAGSASAHAFQKRGCNVTLIDQHGRVASGASSTPAAIFMPRLTAAPSVDGSFYGLAWSHLLRLFTALENQGFDLHRHTCGVLQIAANADEAKRQNAIADSGLLPPSFMKTLDAAEASALARVELDNGGLFFPHGGTVSSQRLCDALVHGLPLINDTRAAQIKQDGDAWCVLDGDRQTVVQADLVVLAGGIETQGFSQTQKLPLVGRLGQVTHAAATEDTARLSCVLTGQGYVTPALSGRHSLGATFDHLDAFDSRNGSLQGTLTPNSDADARNLKEAGALLPGWFDSASVTSSESWVGVRCTTPDHLPVVGPVPNFDAYENDFADIRHGHRWTTYPDPPYHEGLYVLTGLGARGTVSAPLAAEVLVSVAMGEPLPVPRDMAHALHPARFTIRDLKRRPATSQQTSK